MGNKPSKTPCDTFGTCVIDPDNSTEKCETFRRACSSAYKQETAETIKANNQQAINDLKKFIKKNVKSEHMECYKNSPDAMPTCYKTKYDTSYGDPVLVLGPAGPSTTDDPSTNRKDNPTLRQIKSNLTDKSIANLKIIQKMEECKHTCKVSKTRSKILNKISNMKTQKLPSLKSLKETLPKRLTTRLQLTKDRSSPPCNCSELVLGSAGPTTNSSTHCIMKCNARKKLQSLRKVLKIGAAKKAEEDGDGFFDRAKSIPGRMGLSAYRTKSISGCNGVSPFSIDEDRFSNWMIDTRFTDSTGKELYDATNQTDTTQHFPHGRVKSTRILMIGATSQPDPQLRINGFHTVIEYHNRETNNTVVQHSLAHGFTLLYGRRLGPGSLHKAESNLSPLPTPVEAEYHAGKLLKIEAGTRSFHVNVFNHANLYQLEYTLSIMATDCNCKGVYRHTDDSILTHLTTHQNEACPVVDALKKYAQGHDNADHSIKYTRLMQCKEIRSTQWKYYTDTEFPAPKMESEERTSPIVTFLREVQAAPVNTTSGQTGTLVHTAKEAVGFASVKLENITFNIDTYRYEYEYSNHEKTLLSSPKLVAKAAKDESLYQKMKDLFNNQPAVVLVLGPAGLGLGLGLAGPSTNT